MQLLSFLSAVIFCVILRIPLTIETALTTKSGLAETTVHDEKVSPVVDTKMASQNYSTVTTTRHESRTTSANSSEESLTAAYAVASIAAIIHPDNETTTDSGNLTTHGKTSWTTSHFTENGNLTTSHASTHSFSSETASHGVSDMTSTFSSTPPTTEQTKITDSFSTSALHISTTSINTGTGTRFDAASFLGGIVLALGLCVIMVFGYQCYKNRKSTSPPYRIVDE